MRKAAAIALLISLLLQTGCWDRTEIEDTAFVSTVGVDLEPQNEFLWTLSIPSIEQAGRGERTKSQTGTNVVANMISVRAGTLQEAVQLAQASIARILSLDQLRYVVAGEDVARQGLAPLVSQLMRHNQVRRGIGISVALGRAVETMSSFSPILDTNAAKIAEGLLLAQKRVHLAPPIRFHQFFSRMISPGEDPILPVEGINPKAKEPPGSPLPPMANRSFIAGEFPRSGGNPVEYAGTAVFRGDRLAGFLSVNETIALLALRGEMGKTYQTVPDPLHKDQWVTIRFGQENKPQYQVSLSGGRPQVRVHVQLEGEILSSPSGENFADPDKRRLLENATARAIRDDLIIPMLRKVYGEWGADPVGIGNKVRAHFGTIDQFEAYNWSDHVRDVRFAVEVDLFIRRFGLLLEDVEAPER